MNLELGALYFELCTFELLYFDLGFADSLILGRNERLTTNNEQLTNSKVQSTKYKVTKYKAPKTK